MMAVIIYTCETHILRLVFGTSIDTLTWHYLLAKMRKDDEGKNAYTKRTKSLKKNAQSLRCYV